MRNLKLTIPLLILLLTCSVALARNTKATEGFPVRSPEIIKSFVDAKTGTGYAILSKGRLFFYKRWLTPDANALEATVIDTNKIPDKDKDWFSENYIQDRILWLSKLVLNETDHKKVIKAFKEKTYRKEIQKNGDIVYHISDTNYSEFYFAVRQPGDYIEDATVKFRYVLTL